MADEGAVATLLMHGDDLYVGGAFSRAGEIEAQNIAKWDGNSWSALGNGIRGIGGVVRAMTMFKGDLIVGDDFRVAGSIAATNIARWDGTEWHAVGSGVHDFRGVQALAASETHLYVGGVFAQIGGVFSPGIAVWDGLKWGALGSGVSGGGVTALATRSGELFVGGQFRTAGNKASSAVALWHIAKALKMERFETAVTISWPNPDTNMVLEATTNLTNPQWTEVNARPTAQNNRLTVTEPINTQQRFYRLRQR